MNNYPQYYKIKKENRFLKRINNLTVISVQVIGFKDGSFTHLHMKETFKSEEDLNLLLTNWSPCSQEAYESIMATFFSFARRDGALFSAYRQKKWDNRNQNLFPKM